MASNMFIAFFWNSPPGRTINLIFAVKNRINKLSHPPNLHDDLIKLIDILLQNSLKVACCIEFYLACFALTSLSPELFLMPPLMLLIWFPL